MASLQHADAAGTQIRAPGIAVVRTGRMRHRAFFPAMSVLLVVVHDRIVARRIHPVSIWGSAAIIGTHTVLFILFSTGVASTQAAHSLVRLMGR